MVKPLAPIFIWDRADLMICEDIEAARRYIEPIDVEHGEYTGVDQLGRELMFKLEPLETGRWREVRQIIIAAEEEVREQCWRSFFQACLRGYVKDEMLPLASLSELQSLAIKHWGHFSYGVVNKKG